jgi:hypothetical protein
VHLDRVNILKVIPAVINISKIGTVTQAVYVGPHTILISAFKFGRDQTKWGVHNVQVRVPPLKVRLVGSPTLGSGPNGELAARLEGDVVSMVFKEIRWVWTGRIDTVFQGLCKSLFPPIVGVRLNSALYLRDGET